MQSGDSVYRTIEQQVEGARGRLDAAMARVEALRDQLAATRSQEVQLLGELAQIEHRQSEVGHTRPVLLVVIPMNVN